MLFQQHFRHRRLVLYRNTNSQRMAGQFNGFYGPIYLKAKLYAIVIHTLFEYIGYLQIVLR